MIDDKAIQAIENLHRMKSEGIISEADFEQSKQRILFGGSVGRAADTPIEHKVGMEGHFAWATLPFRRYAQFTGRSSRREFWMFVLLTNGTGLLLAVLGAADTNGYGESGPIGKLMFGLFVLGVLGCFVPMLAVQVRRLHDQDRSGWLVLLNAIPYIGFVIVLVLMALEGTKGENRFGPEPYA